MLFLSLCLKTLFIINITNFFKLSKTQKRVKSSFTIPHITQIQIYHRLLVSNFRAPCHIIATHWSIISIFYSPFLCFFLARYFNYLGNGIHTAGGRSGNDNHYVEQHERGDKALKKFQKKVKSCQLKNNKFSFSDFFFSSSRLDGQTSTVASVNTIGI